MNSYGYLRCPENLRETFLNQYPEGLREMVKMRGEHLGTILAIDRHCRKQKRSPIPFVMMMAPPGEFPKWMWDSLKKGNTPQGKVVV